MWQPMETAPRDGTEILLKTTTGIVSAWFDPPRVVDDYFNGPDVEGCQWICYDDEFQILVEWWSDNQPCPYIDSSGGIVGWMPIPT